MRRAMYCVILTAAVFFCGASGAHASATLRVGNRVLVAGDSSARAEELLGAPTRVTRRRAAGGRRSSHTTSRSRGAERWQFRSEGRTVTVTVVEGRITDIDDRRD